MYVFGLGRGRMCGAEWVRGLGLGFTSPVGTGGVGRVSVFVLHGGVGRQQQHYLVSDILPNTVQIVALSVPLLSAFLLLCAGDRQWTSCDSRWKSSFCVYWMFL